MRAAIEHSEKSPTNHATRLFKLLYCRELYVTTVIMDSTRFDYSTKNMPLPSESDYNRRLNEKTENLRRRMRWKAHFYLNPDDNGKQKESFACHSRDKPSKEATRYD